MYWQVQYQRTDLRPVSKDVRSTAIYVSWFDMLWPNMYLWPIGLHMIGPECIQLYVHKLVLTKSCFTYLMIVCPPFSIHFVMCNVLHSSFDLLTHPLEHFGGKEDPYGTRHHSHTVLSTIWFVLNEWFVMSSALITHHILISFMVWCYVIKLSWEFIYSSSTTVIDCTLYCTSAERGGGCSDQNVLLEKVSPETWRCFLDTTDDVIET